MSGSFEGNHREPGAWAFQEEQEAMEHCVHAVPSALREQFVLTDGFAEHLKQRGWTLSGHRPIYIDRSVIRQRWLLCPGGKTYTDREFYHLFGEWNFRALLRALLATSGATKETLLVSCPDETKHTSYLAFLHDQEMLLYTKVGISRGPALRSIQDVGHTLEWWCAEWLGRAFASQGHIPVRHGVMFTELVKGGDTGDLDVVACFDDTLLLIECKSSLLQIDPMTLNLFFWRAAQFEPDLAVLLIDAPRDQTRQHLAKMQRRLTRWRFKPVDGDGEQGVYWNEGLPCAATGPCAQSVYWDRGIIYAALSTEHHSLEHVLSTVLHHYQSLPGANERFG